MPEENLVLGVTREDFWEDLEEGDGSEDIAGAGSLPGRGRHGRTVGTTSTRSSGQLPEGGTHAFPVYTVST